MTSRIVPAVRILLMLELISNILIEMPDTVERQAIYGHLNEAWKIAKETYERDVN